MEITRPYDKLYIYLINGRVDKDEEVLFGQDFIGTWVEEDSSFLFFSEPADSRVDRLLLSSPDLELADSFRFTYEEWQGGNIEPIRVGVFLVTPPWISPHDTEGTLIIKLDPGVVFGNCLHPTTRDCLKAISFASVQKPFRTMIDIGTGTGVLAIAGACLGAYRVLAVDLNPLSVKTASKNVELNKLDGVVKVEEGRGEDFLDEEADLLVANIHYDVICRLIEKEGFCRKQRVIFSGLLRSQWAEIQVKLALKGFHVVREWDYNMTWFTAFVSRD